MKIQPLGEERFRAMGRVFYQAGNDTFLASVAVHTQTPRLFTEIQDKLKDQMCNQVADSAYFPPRKHSPCSHKS